MASCRREGLWWRGKLIHLVVGAYVEQDGNVSVPLKHDPRVVAERKRPAAHEWTAELVSFQTWVVRIVLEQPDFPS